MVARLWQTTCQRTLQTPIPGKQLPKPGYLEANKKMKRISINGIIISIAIAATTVTANATQLTYNNNKMGSNVTINFPGHSGDQVFAGAFNCSLTGAPTVNPSPFNAFCVDLTHTISPGQTWDVFMTRLPDGGLNQSGRIAYLYTTFADGLVSNDDAAGLQLAIWDLLVDGGDGLGTGSFTVASAPAAASTAAANCLTLSEGQIGTATWFQSVGQDKQNLIGPRPVPEPGTLALLGTMALPLLGFCRRRK